MSERRLRPGIAWIAVAVSLPAAVGCAPAEGGQARHQAAQHVVISGSLSHPLLAVAIAEGRDLGPLPDSTVLHFTLGLAGGDPSGLAAALAAGERFSPAEFASRFGPQPVAAARLRGALAAGGITSAWEPGDPTMSASGAAASVAALFNTRIDQRVGPDGLRFYAPTRPVTIPASMAGVVNGVSGLDDYPSNRISVTHGGLGVTPSEMLDYYDMSSLRNTGFDGSGSTIVFVEIDQFDPRMLSAYAQKFDLPAFNVTVREDSAAWGRPSADQGEADLDLEIAHGIAPGANEVVFDASADSARLAAAEAAAYRAFPQGAIESKSLGACEVPDAQSDANVLNDETARAAAQGWTMFVSSGDRGAYGCVPDGDFNTLSSNLAASVPSVTAVGGTYVLLSTSGRYLKEAAWGEPIEQWGSGGGPSIFWPLPSWQAAPGVRNQFSSGKRQTPDISANADPESGWDVFASGMEVTAGGTSAAAPFWAAAAAIIDQDLRSKNLPPIGFANPGLYLFAQNPAGLPAPPYHDVTLGTNLYYPATPGWDFATGLGTPDVAALTKDFEWLRRSHG